MAIGFQRGIVVRYSKAWTETVRSSEVCIRASPIANARQNQRFDFGHITAALADKMVSD